MFLINHKENKNRSDRVCIMFVLIMMAAISLNFYSPALAQENDPLEQFRVEDEGDPAQTADSVPNIPSLQFEDEPARDFSQFQIDPNLSVEEQRAQIEQQMRDTSYDAALSGLMPMSPEEIRRFLRSYQTTREASEERIGGAPKPEVKVETVSLDPGVVPPVIKLSPGHVTSLTLLDLTGQPWPVKDVTWGGNFEVISPGDGGHVVRINPMGAHEVGNMSIQLVDLKTPVTFTLRTQNDVVQYRFDARIPEYGPLAEAPIIDTSATASLSAAKDKDLTRLLGGVRPDDMEVLILSGVDNRTTAYKNNGRILLRTPLTLLSPAWDASVKSADGTTVYSMGQSPVLLLSDRGKMVRATIAEKEKGY